MLSPRVLIPFAIVTMIWGSTWLVITGQLGVVDPAWSVAYRFLLAGAVMLAYAVATGHSLALGRAGQVFAAVFGLAQFVFNFNFVYRAEHHVTSGLVAVVFALLIVPNAILGRLFLGSRVGGRFIAGSVVAMTGVALLFVHEARADPGAADATLLGVALTMAGVLCASVANIMQATERARALPMPSLIGWGMVWGGLIDAAFAWASAGPPAIELSLTYIAGLLYLSIAASAVAFSLYFQTIRDIGPARAAYSSVLIPVIAMALSTLFEGYRWSLLAAGGGVLVLIGMGVALSQARPASAQRADSP
jgi:drug/metabolite transporter (DMT)-like permease